MDAAEHPLACVLDPAPPIEIGLFRESAICLALEYEHPTVAGIIFAFAARWGGGGVVLT